MGASRPEGPTPKRRLRRIIAWSAYALIWFVGLGELGARWLSREELAGLHLLNLRLLPLPRVPDDLAERLLSEPDARSYVMEDRRLGWVIRPNARSESGLFASNQFGFRDAGSDRAVEPSAASRRVLLVGDSFTHGDELTWPETWACHLGETLGAQYTVFNAGVPGYGTDQACLRGESLLAELRPQVVVLSLCRDDLWRNVNVVRSLYHHWTDFPWSKPRFVLQGEGIELVNSPTLRGPELLAQLRDFDTASLRPFESCYSPDFYRESVLHHSRLYRYWWSKREHRARHNHLESLVRDGGEATVVTARILQRFQSAVRAAGARPVVALLPSTSDLASYLPGNTPKFRPLLEAARALSVEVLDLCPDVISRIEPGEKTAVFFVRGVGHPNERMTRIIADRLASEITTR